MMAFFCRQASRQSFALFNIEHDAGEVIEQCAVVRRRRNPCVIGQMTSCIDASVFPCNEWLWAAAIASGRAAWT